MDHIDVLEIEYKEQYNQYRWIGQMQAAVLTFYGVVTAIAMAAVAAFRPQAPTPIDYHWPAGVMIALGFLGLFIGYGLFRSRAMQRRTHLYLTTLIVEMARATDAFASVQSTPLRFRTLCSTHGNFKLSDTMNIFTLIAVLAGEAFVITGILALFVVEGYLCLYQATVIGAVVVVVLFLATRPLTEKYIVKREEKRMMTDYLNASTQTLPEMMTCIGLPKDVVYPSENRSARNL